jgi:hypothetical protein
VIGDPAIYPSDDRPWRRLYTPTPYPPASSGIVTRAWTEVKSGSVTSMCPALAPGFFPGAQAVGL